MIQTDKTTEPSASMGMGRHRRSIIETALLISLLRQEGHGYALLDEVNGMVGDEVCVDPGSVYRFLRSLEESGMVASTWSTGESGPARRTYRVTPAGRELLGTWGAFLRKRGQAIIDLGTLAEVTLEHE